MTREIRYVGEIRVVFGPNYTDREFLENLISSVGIPILVVNSACRVALWNEGFSRVWRHPTSEQLPALGVPLEQVVAEFAQPIRGRDWLEATQQVIDSGQSQLEQRVPLRLGGQTPRLYDIAIHPLRRRGGEVLGAVIVLEDVSEQVMLERRLLRIARTSSLANLGASVAHEIRNPLNSIGLNIQRLQEKLGERPEAAGEDTLDILHMIGDEVRRLERVVKDFLNFSRPKPAERRSVDLGELVRRCMAVLAEEARASGVTLRDNLAALPAIEGDPDLLTQAFQNLLLNAIQAAHTTRDQRPARVEVECFETTDAIAVTICDTGPGVPTGEGREKIFDLFYSTREGGTGLGLAIANRIIEDHGGSITATNSQASSEEIGGASFTVYLPRVSPTLGESGPDDERWM